MKLIYAFLIVSCFVFPDRVSAQGVTKYGESTNSSSNFVNQNGQTGSSSGINKNGQILALATLTTTTASSITNSSASSGGNITSNGGATITARGVCWSTSANPTIANNKTIDGTGTGTFISSITLLSGDSTYYVRAYATNSVGTAYGNQISFTTSAPTLATITTTLPSSITTTTANSGGNITNSGGATVTSRGVCWNTTKNPTTANGKTNDGTGTGIFTSSITALTAGTKYYVRAYAVNSVGTAYGINDSLTTLTTPTITTTTPSSITVNSASSGGNITNNGGAAVTARGVCWGTTTNPTTANSITSNGAGNGTFTSNMTVLTPNTTYYIRAYATNSVGTAYGNQDTLKTYTGTVTDCDGHLYYTVTIGTQVWMAENLKSMHYRTGCTAIPYSTTSSATGAYCYYATYDSAKYAMLYNWYAVTSSDSLAPAGFHIPTNAEYTTLINYLGGSSSAGAKLKEAGTTDWMSPNTGATNSSGFTALPGGYDNNGTFTDITEDGNFWTTSTTGSNAYYIYLYYGSATVQQDNGAKTLYLSVRCIKN